MDKTNENLPSIALRALDGRFFICFNQKIISSIRIEYGKL